MRHTLRISLALALLLLGSACGSKNQGTAGSGGGTGGSGGSGGSAPPFEICYDGIDNDGNDKVDCADPACFQDSHCPACGDGFLDPRELCDGSNVGGTTCFNLGFEAGGTLACSTSCTYDTRGCKHTERCDVVGDEDGNHKADCLDPACATYAPCYKVTPEPIADQAFVSSRVELEVEVLDGTNRYTTGVPVVVTGPAGSAVEQEVVLTSGTVGRAKFGLWMPRKPGTAVFQVSIPGAPTMYPVNIDVAEGSPGTVVTVVNALRASGQDVSGPASLAQVGSVLDVQVTEDGTLYVAEPCRILSVSPDGELSLLAGDGSCGQGTDDAVPALGASFSVSGISLDDAATHMYVADTAGGRVRVIDLASGQIKTFAGGGTLEGAASEGQPARTVRLSPNGLSFGKGAVHVSDAIGNRVVTIDPATGTLTTELSGSPHPEADCLGTFAMQDCSRSACRIAADATAPFVAGLICGTDPGGGMASATSVPGIVRLDKSGAVRVAGMQGGKGGTAVNTPFDGPAALAFDAAGNLFAAAGNLLLRVDAVTTQATQVNHNSAGGDAGDGGPVGAASFSSPSGLAFGPGNDLYVADTGNGAIRRIVGAGSSKRITVKTSVVSGDAQTGGIGTMLPKPLVFRATDGANQPVVAISTMKGLDGGGIVYGEGTSMKADGTGQRSVRMSLIPGPETFEVDLLDLDGTVVGSPILFHVSAGEPDTGALVTLVGVDGTNAAAAHVKPGHPVPAQRSQIIMRGVAPMADGSMLLSAPCQILKYTPADGMLSVFAGTDAACATGGGDGGPADAAGIDPLALMLDANANILYAGDDSNSMTRIRAIDLNTGIIRTVIGGGTASFVNGIKATDVSLGGSRVLYLDGQGRVYVAGFGVLPWILDPATGTLTEAFTGTMCPDEGSGQSPLPNVYCGAFDGDLAYVSAACSPYRLARIDPGPQMVKVGPEDSYDMVVDPLHRVVMSTGSQIWRYDPAIPDPAQQNAMIWDISPLFASTISLTSAGHLVLIGGGPVTIIW